MPLNPYDNPEFAKQYALAQVDRSKNLYEFEVTHPATLQFLDRSVERALDYGCGTGIFTASTAMTARHNLNPDFTIVGTDASEEMLKYAALLKRRSEGVLFEKWDAILNEIPLEEQSFQRIFAKLVLNYVSRHELSESVMPRLRKALSDDGLLVAVLPNPLREANYSFEENEAMNELLIDVGNFNFKDSIRSYHHTYDSMMQSAANAGFQYARALGLPDVRFQPYKQKLMPIAQPMPMIFDTLNAAKRWLYVFGATEAAADNFDQAVLRFENWRSHHYPEIADRVHFRLNNSSYMNTALPIGIPHEAMYDYIGPGQKIVVAPSDYVENLNPRQKIKLSRKLARNGLRNSVKIEEILVADLPTF